MVKFENYVRSLPDAGKLNSVFEYSPVTGILSFKHDRQKYKKGDVAGKPNKDGYLTVAFNNTSYMVHRLIWKMVYGIDPNTVNHINYNRSDNRLYNLESISQAKNKDKRQYSKRIAPNVSVLKHSKVNRYSLKVNGIYVGMFVTKDEAVKYYNEHGDKTYTKPLGEYEGISFISSIGFYRIVLPGRLFGAPKYVGQSKTKEEAKELRDAFISNLSSKPSG